MLPKFKIAVELDEPYYQPGQKVRGTLSARYFFGKPVENGEVEVDVQAGEIGPITAGRSLLPGGTDHVEAPGGEIGANAPHPSPLPEGEGNQKLPSPSGREAGDEGARFPSPSGRGAGGEGGDPLKIAHTLVRTDSSGMARFEFVLPPSLVGRPQDSGDARFLLTATVRDSAGQKQSATVSRIVTEQPIRIEVIPESGTLVRGLPNTIYFLTTYADGRPVPACDRRQRLCPGDPCQRHGRGIDRVHAAGRLGPLARPARRTQSGRRGRREVTLECGSPAERFLVRTDKAVYDGGQTVHVLALGGGSEPLFLDLIKDGQTMLTDVVPMAKGRGEYQIDLPPELSGTLQLCAYRFGREGLPVMQTRVIYVRRAGGLKVEARLDRPEYRPGEQAKLTFSLSDTPGQTGRRRFGPGRGRRGGLFGPRPHAGHAIDLLFAGTGDPQAGLRHLSLVAGDGGQVAGGRAGPLREGPVRQGRDGPKDRDAILLASNKYAEPMPAYWNGPPVPTLVPGNCEAAGDSSRTLRDGSDSWVSPVPVGLVRWVGMGLGLSS